MKKVGSPAAGNYALVAQFSTTAAQLSSLASDTLPAPAGDPATGTSIYAVTVRNSAAAVSGVMLARQLRVEKIQRQWKLDEERQQKQQQRMGTQPGIAPGTGQRGMRGTAGQDTQSTTGRTRRYR